MRFFFSQTMAERPKRPDSHAYTAILADGDGDDEKSTGFFRYSDFLLTFVGNVGGDGVLHWCSVTSLRYARMYLEINSANLTEFRGFLCGRTGGRFLVRTAIIEICC